MPRPSSPRLSRDAVVAAALKIVDSDGVGALSTRRLAADLGVSGPSLYHHFASKEEILAGIVAGLYERIELTASAPDWKGVIAEYAQQLRALLTEHPHVVELVLTAPIRSAPQLRVYDHMARTLAESGCAPALSRQIIFATDSLVFGAQAMTNAARFDPDDAGQSADYPALTRMAAAAPPMVGATFAMTFDAFLAGLDRVISSSARTPGVVSEP